MKKIVALFILIALSIVTFTSCGTKTLAEITSVNKGGGELRLEIDSYTTVELYFYGDTNYDGQSYTNCCRVLTRYYKSSPTSPTGKIFDSYDEYTIPCTITEHTVVLNGIDVYNYSIESKGKYEYVVFSKPLLGSTSWYINK